MPQLESIIQNDGSFFDLIIIGAGPAGLTAALYAGRARLKTLIIEKALIGGMAATTDRIENYPGFPEGISGMDLSHKFEEAVRKLEIPIYYGDVTTISRDRSIIIEGKKIKAKAIIIASGTETKKLGVEGEDRLRGRGISYCATCDGPFYRDKNIAVAGGGNSAVEEAIYLTRFAKKVSIIHRREKLRADKILVERALNDPKIFMIWDSIIEKIEGEKRVEALSLYNNATKIKTKIPMEGLFIYVGRTPNSSFAKEVVNTNKNGFIKTDQEMKTSVPGIFACGDVISKSLWQIVTATGEGAVAAESARKFIEEEYSDNAKKTITA
ncbi:thioredoxin-disulfide reductase [candidate division WOR-1 bacterium RIFOXYC2_FULL_37_10]|uniref:Thioredoxin reductase n=1 Tax=candidate division WOR-1 bacterium RIFOXYB2_FULL_37_13 TaxID=1802579 RepID=A0A1F4SJM0_UNCSA|nr:MAG: thioredoxin-disulfide reductase [candidate division WOR-1 bacterium RIFOXYB2_FULL_37_13]OGC32965.1 MAG: thioredoxin-disulfide reductase [candidate division WOR-1 bacterium RIFOXYC2_FULL_37_10]